jgi:hypothetical protein
VGPSIPDLFSRAVSACDRHYREVVQANPLRSVSAPPSSNDDVFCRSSAWRSAIAVLLRFAGLASSRKTGRCSD